MMPMYYPEWGALTYDAMVEILKWSADKDYREWEGDTFGIYTKHEGQMYDIVCGKFYKFWDGGKSYD